MKSINCLGGIQDVLHFSEGDRLLNFFTSITYDSKTRVSERASERAKFTSLFL